MERARHRKSKGIVHFQKVGSKRDGLFMHESGQTGPTRTPMKKLLAEEMSRGVEPRRRPPSLIARLMGLEGLPSPRHAPHGQQKCLSDTNQPKSRSLLYDHRTTGYLPSLPEFKDVYEDLEAASRISVLKPYETKSKPTSGPHISLKREDGLLLERRCDHHSRGPWSPSRPRSEVEIEQKKIPPMRIVILKPNMGRSQGRKNSSSTISKEAREIAREITMRMRDGYDMTDDSRSVWGGGYDAGDESSYEGNGSDSGRELEGFGFPCSESFGYPSVTREAKTRLSQRCQLTHNYREVVNNQCGTLGEMLALPDRETRLEMSPEPSKIVQKQPSSSVTVGDQLPVQEQGISELNEVPTKQASPSSPSPVAGPEPTEISKEAHPSPNSVLEAHFTEGPSPAESFERVGAELKELRLQLQLLKMESSIDADVSALCPIEEERTQTSSDISKGNYDIAPKSWEVHYALEVLAAYTTFQTSWYSPNSPLDPKLFDSLEEKYSSDLAAGAKWERKLFFDRMNSALMLNPKYMASNLVEKLVNRLEVSEVETPFKAVDREMGWVGPRGEVEMVGDEIGRLLMDDMVAEAVLCM